MQRILWILLTASGGGLGAPVYDRLFPGARETHALLGRAVTASCALLPTRTCSQWGLKFALHAHAVADDTVLLHAHDLQVSLSTTSGPSEPDNWHRPPDEARPLTTPWQARFTPTGALEELRLPADEPGWSANIKRAISVSLQLQAVGKTLPGAYSVREPCLHGDCIVEYSSSDGTTIRKSQETPTATPGVGRRVWASLLPDICSKDVKKPIIGDTERWYHLDDQGIISLKMISSLQYHADNHILETFTNLTIERVEVRPLDNPLPAIELPAVTSANYKLHSYADPTLGRQHSEQGDIIRSVIQILITMADMLDAPGITRDAEKLHNQLPIQLNANISMMTVESLDALMKEVEVGTSYKQETMLNIFLEALPQTRSRNSAVFVKDLIVKQRIKDENTLLQLIRKLPFNIAEFSHELLKELEPLMQLNRASYSSDVRHTGVLSFATIVFKAFINGACTPDHFEEYVQIYFSNYAESKDYSDRMTYLQGLSNLQMERVSSYLAPIIAGTSSAVTSAPTIQHERFLAVWATMALASLFPVEVNKLYWPILTDTQENLEMRVAALTMLLLSDPTPRRVLALHWYITADRDPHLRHFWYTTVKSLEKTTYPCYKPLSRLAGYVSPLTRPPAELRYWSTGNYLVDAWDSKRDSGVALQTLLFAQPATGLPAVFYCTFQAHAKGLITNQYSIYLKMTGVSSNFLDKLKKMNAQSVKMEELAALLAEMKVEPKPQEKVHIEIILKYQLSTIYTSYINQTTFDRWTSGDFMQSMNTIFQSESHVNQQFVSYPIQVEVSLPTELGTPLTLSTIVSSVTSLRGNLTHYMSDAEMARENDVHLRYSSLALTFVTTYNPLLGTRHTAEVSQASATYLPLNLRLAIAINDRVVRLRWLSPAKNSAPGAAAHSRALVSLSVPQDLDVNRFCKGCQLVTVIKKEHHHSNVKNDFLFDCEAPLTLPTLIGQLLESHQANFNMFPALRPLLIASHAVLLAATPTADTCGAALLPSQDVPLRTDLELSLADFNLQEKAVTILYGLVVRKNVANGEQLRGQNGTTFMELTNNRLKLSVKASGTAKTEPEDWKLCADMEQRYLGGPEQDLSPHPGPFELEAMAVLGPPSAKTCPSNGTMLKVRVHGQVKVAHDHDITRIYKIHVYGKNLPASVQRGASRAAALLGLADGAPWAGVAGAGLAGRIAQRLAENPATLEGTVQVDKLTTSASLAGDAAAVVVEGDDGVAWLLDSRSELQLLRDLGLYRECRLGGRSLQTLDGVDYPVNVTAGCFGLAVGDCSPTPRLALLYAPRGPSVEVRLYTGGNYASIAPGNPPQVGVNGKLIDWKKGYKYPEDETFYDFRVWGTDESVRVDSGISGAVLAWTSSGVTILLPNTYMATLRGVCVSPEERYTKCDNL